MSAEAFGNVLIVIAAVFCLGLVGLFLTSLRWVYRDATKHGRAGCLWLLIAFFTWPLGVLIYRAVRD